MKRRDFLRGATVAGVASAASALAAPALAQGVRELKMVTTWPKNFPGLGTGAQRLADSITAMSEGKLKVTLYSAGELVPALESFDAVSGGTADMYHGAEYYWQGKNKAFNFFAAVPFGLTANEMDAWVNYGGGQQLWDELSAKFNIKPFAAGNTGVQMAGWYNKEIKSVEDYKGLKIRMPGLGGEVLRRLGAAAVTLPGGEIFPALQSGAIDATEWVGPWNDLAFGFYKVTKYYYWPGFHEPGSTLSCGMNKGVWDSLDAGQKSIIQVACAAENNRMYSEFNAKNGDALVTLVEKHGVKLRQMPNDVMMKIGEISGEVVRETGQSDPLAQKVYDSFIKFRKNAIAYEKISSQAYANARLLPFKY
ncbi:TRAP transporter substrate-binding protein [Varunaivibrio sulfuroxidans]|uniref:TRAP-type mannitol/chloroaromatic compound transport system substrate-binding protein n=1 Tax=Varunaivibrio sulfuroxidans TaxID=1773489 RepID=A0A4R3JDV0_9PROT|nr:TRAP transporter substrate-binding protein [Varunaivibrio sulfuroxidans]TCS64239.1 TRAP-type mannitol/chloroaromatic compound transport system substrate-binding protein [Varunaivibrio sulfuroxidans]WES31320.1 TRAP transporter substrate-binding protein [Varunaivibrio sulfuroxidans]